VSNGIQNHEDDEEAGEPGGKQQLMVPLSPRACDSVCHRVEIQSAYEDL
jgi:hypothetical protein